MQQQPFSTTGGARKLAELYALSYSELQDQCAAIRSNFEHWLKANFLFDDRQQIFIGRLDAGFKDYLATTISQALGSRLPISLQIPDPRSGNGISKIIGLDYALEAKISPNGDYDVQGQLTIKIAYE